MNIKKHLLFLFIFIASFNIHAMEVPCTDKEQAFLRMAQTVQYQAYEEATRLHEKHNASETKELLEEALELLLKTQETQSLLRIADPHKSSEAFSNNMLTKYSAMEQTQEHKQYEDAKQAHQELNTADTAYMLNLCKTDFYNTKECLDWLTATNQEKHILKNIIQSEKWIREQKQTTFKPIETVQNNRKNAWVTFMCTEEYQRFQRAQEAHDLHRTSDTFSLLTMCQQHAKETTEYKQFHRLSQELRTLTGHNNRPQEFCTLSYPKAPVYDCFYISEGKYIPILLTSSSNNNNSSPK